MMQETEQNRICCRSNVFAGSSLAGNAAPLGQAAKEQQSQLAERKALAKRIAAD
jgi:hypothetical protein